MRLADCARALKRIGYFNLCFLALTLAASPLLAAPPTTGAETEKRFPPLVVPPGFKATLYACDPLVQYPSVIAIGPRAGTLFVARDYLTGLGTEIMRRDEIHLLQDTDGDGYADADTLFADNFNSLQGLAFFDGTVYAMHAPFLTALRDTNGDGKADERKDLLTGPGLPPEKNPPRLHCANGVTAGHDGWLYLAIGDHGADIPRPEGGRLVLNGGGLLRCRRDGRELHTFAMGLRNVYDVALDDEQNVFLRDNENDGGDYLLRISQSFPGADHGYPYLYRDHPQEALAPLADLGRGSSAGGACYLETAFPKEMRGDLFFCEWGRALVRAKRSRPADRSGFAQTSEVDFVAGATADPYGFKPTDVVVDRDGSLLISDWGDDQRPKRGRGRIYRITWNAALKTALPASSKSASLSHQLDSPSYETRLQAQVALEKLGGDQLESIRKGLLQRALNRHGRMHAVWILAHVRKEAALDDLYAVAESDPEPAVRTQAIRAITDLAGIPVSPQDATWKNKAAQTAVRLSRLSAQNSPAVLLEQVITLGRLEWRDAPNWLRSRVTAPDNQFAHAVQQMLRRSGNWSDILKLLDEPESSALRSIALRAMADEADPILVDGLISQLKASRNSQDRIRFASLLARVHRKPGPWSYWGYRPPPRPADTVAWDRTPAIAAALSATLADSDFELRMAALKGMLRDRIPIPLERLRPWLKTERDPARVSALVASLAQVSDVEVRTELIRVIEGHQYSQQNRLEALAAYFDQFAETGARMAKEDGRLLETAGRLEDGPVLAEWIRSLSHHAGVNSSDLIVKQLDSPRPEIRAAAVEAAARKKVLAAFQRVAALLQDADVSVRRAAADTIGKLATPSDKAPPELLQLAGHSDLETVRASLSSLRQLKIRGAVPQAVAALRQQTTQAAALEYLEDFGGPEQTPEIAAAGAGSRSTEFLTAVIRLLNRWEPDAATTTATRQQIGDSVARLQGESGLLLSWNLFEPKSAGDALRSSDLWAKAPPKTAAVHYPATRKVLASGMDLRIPLKATQKQGDASKCRSYAWNRFDIAEACRAEFFPESDSQIAIVLDGKGVYEHRDAVTGGLPSRPDAQRFVLDLKPGPHWIVVSLPPATTSSYFQLRFRRLGSSAAHERLAQFTLRYAGNPDVGRELFLKKDKSLCLKCHSMNGSGAKIGPDLTGIGARFSRIHLIESILEPSRTVAPAYEQISLILNSGRIVNGVKVAETSRSVTVGDEQGNLREIPLAEIEERQKLTRSLMPDGLEKQFTEREFADLVSFLVSQKKPPAKP